MARSTKKSRPHPIALIILEGFGIAQDSDGNAITRAKTPYLDHIISHYPVAALEASAASIGLEAQMAGGSEIGHTVIGTGRPWPNKKYFVTKSLADGSFAAEKGFVQLKGLLGNKNLHINFLLSHASEEYSIEDLKILLEWLVSQGQERIFLHCILDGVKSSATSGQGLIKELEKMIKVFPQCRIASLIGSLYALDAKHNEGRLDKAFALLAKAEATSAEKAVNAIAANYEKKIFDEEFPPTIISGHYAPVQNDDILIFWNYNLKNATGLINRLSAVIPGVAIFTMTDEKLGETVIPLLSVPQNSNSLGTVLAAAGLKQLRISDSVGFPDISFFLDGTETVQKNISRELIATDASLSPLDAALDSIQEISRFVIEATHEAAYDFMGITFSQMDTLAHRGDFDGLVTVIEKIDNRLQAMVEAITALGGVALIVGSHGFAERTLDTSSGRTLTAHSLDPVIFSVIGKQFEGYNLGWPEAIGGDLSLLSPIGSLVDVAPTILSLALLGIPSEMSGHNLIP